ncbi:hypothetical protein P8935_05215 [Telmatobacter sp. DSM 110680]|uniref:Uncharacterized protein n=1 Tax=Telmatobacter sp. DSM 110680 TaxID=3036704 RepID=A0AAU7DNR2_9BACT
MIENPADLIPAWMLLSAAFGYLIGEACGDLARHRKCLEQNNAELRDQLQHPLSKDLHRELAQQRKVINDIHSRLVAVSKGLEKRPD